MRRVLTFVTAVLPLLLGAVLAPTAAQAADINTMLLNDLKGAGNKLVQLAEAMPESTYGWRPTEGVRSTSEVFMHVASSNYFFASRLTGTKPPAEVQGMEKNVTAKSDVVAKLKESLDAIYGALEKADLAQATKLFGGREGTMGDMALLAVTHAHEHLGQLIAYARSNNVTPPWSQ